MDSADGDAAGDNADYATTIHRPQRDAFFPFREASGPGRWRGLPPTAPIPL